VLVWARWLIRAPRATASSTSAERLVTAFALMSGPIAVPSSKALPTASASMAAPNFSTKASATDACT
jgi:hypothetical protein